MDTLFFIVFALKTANGYLQDWILHDVTGISSYFFQAESSYRTIDEAGGPSPFWPNATMPIDFEQIQNEPKWLNYTKYAIEEFQTHTCLK